MRIDPTTPVVIGVGQSGDRIDTPDYQAWSSIDLGAAATRNALADTGVASVVAEAIDVIAAVREMENMPHVPSPLGRSNNYPRSVARRVGLAPERVLIEVVGGQSPQSLVTEHAEAIARGSADCVLIVGAEATSTARHFADRDDRPDFGEEIDGQLDDRGPHFEDFIDMTMVRHRLTSMPVAYAFAENARRNSLGVSVDDHRRAMGRLFAPFTEVAAANPFAASPVIRSADELATITDANRVIAQPYPRLVVARDLVNVGSAIILTSAANAAKMGVPRENWVFLHGHTDLREHALLARADLGTSPAAAVATSGALEMAGIGVDDLATVDLYSCFPIPVFNVCDALGFDVDAPIGLTVTGGLPFFGGPGHNYSSHAIVETVERLRRQPDAFGLVVANGGIMSKTSVGVYSTTPANWTPRSDRALQAGLDDTAPRPVAEFFTGSATLDTYTVDHGKRGPVGVVVATTHDDDTRVAALTSDDALLALLETGDPFGVELTIEATEGANSARLA
ncbi:acetyl-CoA acetyltransferase [Gordonia sp. 852002-50816_SCH5313054-c]|uniref:acetyl-CoA acetyltransferase n=1 Tax=unclassified Gordonia (in: high G+C Gram-positive bacteria) TaxID=2657482 RepID=UPI0007EA924F|nr:MULTISPECIES: acetyl-CoA acetyltransferase [unclassified Gordonia (in: high G+C Gram-positive bacteria)]OBC16954.1 acetyl-CoA acetyltransferase [Gordonia sp. 852002-50816_SCH5313054-a]OBC19570.1 acetyl-CoA acetyltransferase [Gordonia sp. 852002-50816_SCH5313054-c]